ncbi:MULTISPECIES: TetR/AcrR family transcriptional regulator [Mycobacteriaceae]|uniref:TetR family transcriptional regulator n=1 Tax=Mycolicibacterium neoaurum VKM Ac-1815D TaxID=700508 RepID=V5XD91_MYCNE|nr:MULTISPECIES: TetR/AcrR family transcriptional regulator [Mycobacteriaceae]AHC25783.1 TetR family transcriptional regulator [Mycolicibacterium neoaurum VKM Ac-1815D]AMO06202.1 TetR family transcriptional regulator [Mycolicibacterium neoaurum]AXK75452.1 TetR/AcrR family transcriptional regulator [Mycolicibacterium neoaurum]KJQ50301.1 TetR family transcriptional regulator [Mycolicibacterium neoaurum]KUM09458.1 TetR family transcriptional regulator [Mycolicibacterium neoaurum]
MTSPARALRADAARNRESLLAAAEEVFAERGVDASIADVARRAGVAKGTVFRHFSSKEDLVASLVCGHMVTLTDAAARLADAYDPGAALLEFLTIAADQRRQHDLTYLQTFSANDARVIAIRDDVLAGVEKLVAKARAAGAIRADVTGTDVFLLMCAPVHVAEGLPDAPPDLWRRYLAIIFDGLRPEGASALPEPEPEILGR